MPGKRSTGIKSRNLPFKNSNLREISLSRNLIFMKLVILSFYLLGWKVRKRERVKARMRENMKVRKQEFHKMRILAAPRSRVWVPFIAALAEADESRIGALKLGLA